MAILYRAVKRNIARVHLSFFEEEIGDLRRELKCTLGDKKKKAGRRLDHVAMTLRSRKGNLLSRYHNQPFFLL